MTPFWTHLRREEAEVRRRFFGVVRGVTFDLRQASVSPDQWDCPCLVTDRPPDHPGFVILPELEDVGGVAVDSALVADRIRLVPGDRVTATGATFRTVEDDPLAHPADREVVTLTLTHTSHDGSQNELPALTLRRRGAISEMALHEEGLRSILAQRLQDILSEDADLAAVQELAESIEIGERQLLDKLRDGVPSDRQGLLALGSYANAARLVHRLVEDAVLYGYEHGRREASYPMEPLARELLQVRRDRRKGQQEAVRRRTTWRVKGLEVARDFVARNPSASNEGVALEVIVALKGTGLNPPSVSQTTKVIAEWRRSGELPPKRPSSVA